MNRLSQILIIKIKTINRKVIKRKLVSKIVKVKPIINFYKKNRVNKIVASSANKKEKIRINFIIIVIRMKVNLVKTIILIQYIKAKAIDSVIAF